MKNANFSIVPELRPYQNYIYGVLGKVPGLNSAGLMWAPLNGPIVRIRKADSFPETYLVLFEQYDATASPKAASPAASIEARQEAIRSQGMSLGLAGLGLVAGAVGVAAAVGTAPFLIALAGAGAAAYGVGLGIGKLELALKGDMDLYSATIESQDLKDKEFWSDILGLVTGVSSAAMALKSLKGLGAVRATLAELGAARTTVEKAAILKRLSPAQKEQLVELLKDLKKGHVFKNAIPGKAGLTAEQRIESVIRAINMVHGGTGVSKFAVQYIPARELLKVMQNVIRSEQVFQRVAVGAGLTQSYMSGAVGEVAGILATPFGQIEVKLPLAYAAGMESGNNLVIATRGHKGETSAKIVGWTIFQKPVKNYSMHGQLDAAAPLN